MQAELIPMPDLIVHDGEVRVRNRDLSQYFTPGWAAEMLVERQLAHLSRGDHLDETIRKVRSEQNLTWPGLYDRNPIRTSATGGYSKVGVELPSALAGRSAGCQSVESRPGRVCDDGRALCHARRRRNILHCVYAYNAPQQGCSRIGIAWQVIPRMAAA